MPLHLAIFFLGFGAGGTLAYWVFRAALNRVCDTVLEVVDTMKQSRQSRTDRVEIQHTVTHKIPRPPLDGEEWKRG